jgi:hypothetical protein
MNSLPWYALLWLAFLGHRVGDIMFQTKTMGLHKSDKTWRGIGLCTIHVAIYTTFLMLFLQSRDPIVAIAIYVPHWIIDHWSLASAWLGLVRSRTFKAAIESKDQYREFDVAFTSIIYKDVDETMHLLCLWAVIWFL